MMDSVMPVDGVSRGGFEAMRGRLLLLSLVNFAVSMGAFVVIGVLSPIASAFGVDNARAGGLMTSYAVVYALTSPLLVSATGARDRARMLLTGLGLFLAGTVLAALAPSFGALLAARALMALGGGLVTPIATAVALASVETVHRGRALALVFGGVTLAQAFGVPVGAWLGYALGWRVAFWSVAALVLVAALGVSRFVPRDLSVPRGSLAVLGTVLVTPRLMLAVSFTALFIGSTFGVFTYLAPFLESRYGLGRDGVTAMLLLFGLGAVAGNAMGGWLTDRIGPGRTLAVLCLLQWVFLPLYTLVHLPLPVSAGVLGVWSVSIWSVHVPQQARLAALDPAKAPVLLALHAAAIYIGGSMGAAVGGQSISRWGFDALGPAGALLALLALGSLGLVARRSRTG